MYASCLDKPDLFDEIIDCVKMVWNVAAIEVDPCR